MKRTRPVIFVIGCTGTGKSDLGIAIAKKHGGEVISVDSQQLYRGLDIATNKVTDEEMDGVKHHLMSFLKPSDNYNVHLFKEHCISLIQDIFDRDKIPVIVGGTAYYAESVLFNNNLIKTIAEPASPTSDLDQMSADQLYNLLQEVDPNSAAILHPNNKFRVRRAVEIFRLTGKRKSDHLKEQKRADAISENTLRYEDTLVLALDASSEVLDERLDIRVDKMRNNGLRHELTDYYNQYGSILDTLSHGVMQCIGLKEFMPFLRLSEDEQKSTKGDKIFEKGLEEVKLHTRQYSRSQRSWVDRRLIGRQYQRKLPSIKKLDTSDKHTFIDAGLSLVERWMGGEELHEEPIREFESVDDANKTHRCDICDVLISGTNNWNEHLGGKKHKGKRKAMIATGEQYLIGK